MNKTPSSEGGGFRPQIRSGKKPPNLKNSTDSVGDVTLSAKQITDVVIGATARSFASSLPGFGKIFDWIERVEQESREVKMQVLFSEYSSKFDSIESALARLQALQTTRGGQSIFRKIIQIISKGSEDQEWLALLANVLKNVSAPDFEKQFEERMFLLSQIDRLSSQALILLSKYSVWREVNVQGTTTTSGQTAGDWIPQVTRFLMNKMGVHDLPLGARINHSFRELESMGMVNLHQHQLKLTAIGLELQRILG